MKTIVAIFDDISVARQVVEDLVKADFARNSISLITNDAQNKYSRFLEKDYVPREEAVTASEGAGFGAVVGALTGVLVGLVALVIPSIGLAIVAGPIVAGLTGAVAGVLAGGLVGAIIKIGVPEDEAPYYAEAIKRGATLISMETDTPHQAEEILHHYGTINLHERISQWREAGWEGFDTEPETKAATNAPWEILSVSTKETTSTKFSSLTPLNNEQATPALLAEPKLEAEATAKSAPTTLPVLALESPNTEILPESLPLIVQEEAERAYGKGLDEAPLIEL